MTDKGSFGIRLSNPQVYLPGSTVLGNVFVHGDGVENTKGIQIIFCGSIKCSWKDGKQVSSATEQIFLYGKNLTNQGGTAVAKLPSGWHAYPFSFQVPYDIPSSFEGTHGRVKYALIATMKRSLKFDKTYKLTVYIKGILDLNTYPGARNPIALQMQKSFSGLCCDGSGSVDVLFVVSKSGFVSGETVPFSLKIDNESSIPVKQCKIYIVQVGTFQTELENNEKINKSKILLGVTNPVPREEHLKVSSVLNIPSTPTLLPNNLCSRTERIISLTYHFEVELNFPFLTKDFRRKVPIIIGTVPINTKSFRRFSAERKIFNIRRPNNSPASTEVSEHLEKNYFRPISLAEQDEDNESTSSGISLPLTNMNFEALSPSLGERISLQF